MKKNMKKIILIMPLFFLIQSSFAQKRYFTKTGTVSFNAGTALEDVDAVNKSSTCIFDATTGDVQFAILVKGFEFKSALMMEHFNENYMESDKFPKAEFKGEIKDNDDINYSKDGTYKVKVKGKLTMHGESNDVDAEAKIIILNGKISATADFSVKLSDYKISIPGLVADKISKTVKINVSCSLDPLKN